MSLRRNSLQKDFQGRSNRCLAAKEECGGSLVVAQFGTARYAERFREAICLRGELRTRASTRTGVMPRSFAAFTMIGSSRSESPSNMRIARPEAFGPTQNFFNSSIAKGHDEETHPRFQAEFARSWSGATVTRSKAPSFEDRSAASRSASKILCHFVAASALPRMMSIHSAFEVVMKHFHSQAEGSPELCL